MRVLIILPKAYGPPWNEGQKNLARSLVEFLRQRGDSVCVAGSNGISYPEERLETNQSHDAKQIPDRFALLRTVRQAGAAVTQYIGLAESSKAKAAASCTRQ